MASFTIIFDVDKNSATYGKWLFTDTTDYTALGWNPLDVDGWLDISYPNGNGYAGSQSNPDFSGNPPRVKNTISIPQDANGQWLQGTYSFTLNLFNSALTQTINTTISYKYCPPFKFGLGDEGTISTQTDCFQYRLGITDKTHYGTPTTKTELITLYPPQPLIDNGDASVVTSNSSSLLYVFGYTGTYVATVDTLLTYLTTFTNGSVTVTGRVTADKEISVQCSLNICSLIACYNDKLRKLTHQVSKSGYLESVDNALKTDMLMASFYLLAYKENAACGNYDRATDDYNKLAKVLNCDCNCGDKNKISDDIRLVNPSFDTTVAQVYAAIGQGAVQVSTNTVGNNTTFTITLTPTIINLINSNASSITTIEGDITTIQGDILSLQNSVAAIDSLNQVVYETGALAVPATNTWTTTATYTATSGSLEVGSELELVANFYFANANDGRDLRIRINTVEVIVFADASVKAMVGVFMSAKLKLQVLTATTASYQATLSIVNTNLVEQFKTILSPSIGTFAINNIASLSNTIDVQAKQSVGGTLSQLNANVKQFNKV
jgi:hypothetical protein